MKQFRKHNVIRSIEALLLVIIIIAQMAGCASSGGQGVGVSGASGGGGGTSGGSGPEADGYEGGVYETSWYDIHYQPDLWYPELSYDYPRFVSVAADAVTTLAESRDYAACEQFFGGFYFK
ncbi:MAG: hypothetical protein LBR44_03275 [Clostridiales Family XIII bacterium]|jgi:hypothetical protein|nr:hypothetical protein [Clostridiales Family XIII bacterium]